ncbi:MAG: BamA/TamA family outer membrane protein [Flavobacteriales bacterium]|nr:BamA/TamA family outer membrane protein [Flavobacteriales bacterium]MBK9286195.1 BamA/TamA family outer membrane protein [Flavobacteriales bacterium]MBL0034564.1 BamA/TamA family outer membrane protein [Flavobacteriales bacterium]
MRPLSLHILWLLACALLWVGCDPAKRVPQDQHLLHRNAIQEHPDPRNKTLPDALVDQDELRSIIKQKPNKRVLGIPFYLNVYNLRDPQRVIEKRQRSDSLCQVKNESRALKGRKLKTCDQITRGRNGEPPVILDTALTFRSSKQLELYLIKEGFFMAQVSDTVIYKKRKAEVQYRVEPGPAYVLCDVHWYVDDEAMHRNIQERWNGTNLKVGERFDGDKLDKERDRITAHMRELGYLYFNRDLITYDADTGMGDHQVDLSLRIERPMSRSQKQISGSREGTIYHVERVIIEQGARSVDPAVRDTVIMDGYELIYHGDKPLYKPQALLCGMFLHPDQRFNQLDADRTYRRLTNLRVFDRVEIRYDTTGTFRSDGVNCRVQLMPSKTQSFSTEGFGTNRGGFMGTSLSVGYRHKNLFRSMGSITAQVNFGWEAQQSVTGSTGEGEDASNQIRSGGLFNTIEFGPEITFRFPNFLLPVKCGTFARSAAPRTTINILYNFQQRPDYTRSLAKFSFGYEWNESRTKTWGLFPVELNVIKIPYYAPSFLQFLQETNDPTLTDSYTDHLILGAKAMFTLNTQDVLPKRHTYFLRTVLQTSGNLLAALYDLTDQPLTTDSTGANFYTVGNIRFAQFIKLDNDFRYYLRLHDKSSMAFRVAAGVGIAYGNLPVLPFETSFFGGGANGMRAWQARTLGPGSYNAPVSYDRIGDMHIEANAEYRFKLIGYLEGALFVDVGNIWTLRENPAKPGSVFETRDLLKELAIGSGIGARLNFDFFLVRFDLAGQMKDPGQPEGQRWLFQRSDATSQLGRVLNLNLGIGYPF